MIEYFFGRNSFYDNLVSFNGKCDQRSFASLKIS